MAMRQRRARLLGAVVVILTALGSLAASQTRAPVAPLAAPPRLTFTASDYEIVTMGGSGSVLTTIDGPLADTVVSASLTGGADVTIFSLPTPPCKAGGSGQSCLLEPPLPVLANLVVFCAPGDVGVRHVATLTVTGSGSSGDVGVTTIGCLANGGSGSGGLDAGLDAPIDSGGSGSDGGLDAPPDAGITGTILIASAPAPIVSTIHVPASVPMTVSALGGHDLLERVTVFDLVGGSDAALFSFSDARCTGGGGSACDFIAPPLLPSTTLDVFCTPPDLGTHTATLVVTGANPSGSDSATTMVSCQGTSPPQMPTISVSPDTLEITAAVGSSTAGATIATDTATGGIPLSISSALVSGPEFAASDCVSSPCSVPAGSNTPLHVTFAPTVWGDLDARLVLTTNDAAHPTVTVTVHGHGSGAELTSDHAAIAFGTLPRGQSSTVSVTLHDDGNIPVTTTIPPGSAPFTTSTGTVALMAGSNGTFDVTCGSDTASSSAASQTLTLHTPGAYVGSTRDVALTCEVADTNLRVDPTSFDFGEVRIGATLPARTLTITNPGPASVTIDSVALVRDAVGLTLTSPPAARTLAPTEALTVERALATDQPSDLDAPPEAIRIDITEGARTSHLELPVTGKVVEASSSLAPNVLDLGAACVGRPLTGTAVLTNTGTATLHVSPPTATGDFSVAFVDPVNYPAGGASLAPHGDARASVTATTTAEGAYDGTLSWADDASGTQSIAVRARYVQTGTAVSPLALAFGTSHIGISATPHLITLANCGDAPVAVGIGDVNAVEGSRSAWRVSPGGNVPIPAHGETTVEVTFAPQYPGSYNASLQLVVDGQQAAIQLSGFADGAAPRRTFYGCGCQSGAGGSPAGGWPIAAALGLLVIGRRRRGSS